MELLSGALNHPSLETLIFRVCQAHLPTQQRLTKLQIKLYAKACTGLKDKKQAIFRALQHNQSLKKLDVWVSIIVFSCFGTVRTGTDWLQCAPHIRTEDFIAHLPQTVEKFAC